MSRSRRARPEAGEQARCCVASAERQSTAAAQARAPSGEDPEVPIAVVKFPMWLLTNPNEMPVSGSPQPPTASEAEVAEGPGRGLPKPKASWKPRRQRIRTPEDPVDYRGSGRAPRRARVSGERKRGGRRAASPPIGQGDIQTGESVGAERPVHGGHLGPPDGGVGPRQSRSKPGTCRARKPTLVTGRQPRSGIAAIPKAGVETEGASRPSRPAGPLG